MDLNNLVNKEMCGESFTVRLSFTHEVNPEGWDQLDDMVNDLYTHFKSLMCYKHFKCKVELIQPE